MLLWLAFAYLCGSLMFSHWIGLIAKRDVRRVGDGNPGGINLWKAAGAKFGVIGIALDFAKGYVPVMLALSAGYRDQYALALIAAAPVFGHMFSPFLKFRGGKAIAATFGAWSALTGFRASVALALILLVLHIAFRKFASGRLAQPDSDGFQVSLGVMLLPIYLVAADYPAEILLFWLINFLQILYAHRQPVVNVLRKWLFDRRTEQEERGKSIGG